IISSLVKRVKKLPEKRKLLILFSLRLITLLLIIYLIIEGLPFTIPTAYMAIITSSVSVALAFASSGIFENLISGIVLIILNPFEMDDIVRIGDIFGAVRSIKLTKTTIETFDNIFVELSNSDVLSAKIMRYSIKLENIKNFNQFKQIVRQVEKEGFAPIDDEDLKQFNEDFTLKRMFETTFKRKTNQKLHNFTFSMEFDYPRFRAKLEKVDQLCMEYKNKFKFRPRYYIEGLDHHIKINFRLMTLNSDNFFKYQSEFAKKLYYIIKGE
ncbi:MAG: mechanosensitive ion channel domain-containing protein, partial [Candidatus Hermodarchaeota archaeon]